MERIKQASAGVYALAAVTVDEDGAKPTLTAASVTIYDGAGAEVDTGTPDFSTDGALTYSVDVDKCPRLDTYSAVWIGTVDDVEREWRTDFEIVGGFIFEIADLRASDRAFADTAKYPTAVLREVRCAVEDMLESAGCVAFVPRGRRVAIDGNGPDYMMGAHPLLYGGDPRPILLPDVAVSELYALTLNDYDFTDEDLATVVVDDHKLWRQGIFLCWPAGARNVRLHYAHGYAAVPGPVKRAALLLAREYLVASDLPGRATAQSIGDQMFRLTIAGRDGATGLPEVDSAIAQFGRKRFGIG